MAPAGKTALVLEYFCNRGDAVWNNNDNHLIADSIDSLNRIKIVDKQLVFDATVVRIKNAYPLFELGYQTQRQTVLNYLNGFNNINMAGRSGAFLYNNMDQCLLNGITAAEQLMLKYNKNTALPQIDIKAYPLEKEASCYAS